MSRRVQMRNTGTRRVIIGPSPKSERKPGKGWGAIIFDTEADEHVDAKIRAGNRHEVPAEVGQLPTVQAVAEKVGLRVA